MARIQPGIYWKEMPNYAQMNVLENKNKLPDFSGRQNQNELHEPSSIRV
jgi:deoxyribodipyrimidine photolyase-like uncharacterized protein